MRPSEIMMLTAGVIIAVAGIIGGIGVILDHDGGLYWFYWIAPLLAIGLGGMFISMALSYWVKVGRLETKGRPRSD